MMVTRDKNLLLDVLRAVASPHIAMAGLTGKDQVLRTTVVLLTAAQDHAEVVRRLRSMGTYKQGQFLDYLDCGSGRFNVDLSGEVLSDFDAEEMAEVSASLGEFGAALVEYENVTCIRELLARALAGMNGVLDTNFGELFPYLQVLERFQVNPSWDWRASSTQSRPRLRPDLRSTAGAIPAVYRQRRALTGVDSGKLLVWLSRALLFPHNAA